MARITDTAQHPLAEQDWVAFASGASGPFDRGRIESIRTIMERGPYNSGTKVRIVHVVEYMLPPGHTVCPVMKVVPNETEIKESEASAKNPSEPHPLAIK